MLKAIVLLCVVAIATCSLLGGFQDRKVDEEDVLVAANHIAKSLSQAFASQYHHRLAKVLKAESQVVAGTNYKLSLIVGKTDCKKAKVEYEESDRCDFQEGISTYKKCESVVYQNLQDEFKVVYFGCILASKKDL